MKARVLTNEREVRKASRAEYEDMREEIYRECADDIMVQALSVVLWTLATGYGWRKKRLTDFTDALKATNDLMTNPSRLHHRFNPIDIEKQIKSKYGIDIRQKFKAEVEVKP